MIIINCKRSSLIVTMLLAYLLIYAYRPVEVVAVYRDENYVDVIVKNFPSDDKDKIAWWLENNKKLTESFSFLMPASYSHYFITFWDYGDGFQKKPMTICFASCR